MMKKCIEIKNDILNHNYRFFFFKENFSQFLKVENQS